MRLTVTFDSQYWVGIIEMESDGLLYAAHHIFGSEPSDAEVYEFVSQMLLDYLSRMRAGVPIDPRTANPHRNPKRKQREIRREMARTEISTKAQEAMRLQIEQHKAESQKKRKANREAEQNHKREVALQKAKARHRGR